MDHDRYEWSMLTDRPEIIWPENKKLALWVNVCLQFFPINQKGKPFVPTGGLTMPYPDLRHYSLREYGNRVGIYRFLILKKITKKKVIGLGGINKLTIKKLRAMKCDGFASISIIKTLYNETRR